LVTPYLGVGLLCSGLLYWNEWRLPRSSEAAKELRTKHRQKTSEETAGWEPNLNFRNARDGRIWSIGAYHLATGEMKNPQISWRLEDDTQRSLIATRAVRSNGVWVFYRVQELFYDPHLTNSAATNWAVLPVPEFSESPEQIRSEIKISRMTGLRGSKDVQVSFGEILDYLRLHPDLSPRDRTLLSTRLHAGLARPWTCLVVVLIAIPFGIPSGRRNAFVGVASSIFICFAYFILLKFGLALGTGGYLPGWVAAWSPNVLFAAAAVWLIRRVR
jgi:lipopolysaccharide export LptBFGC system permease protein LptF